MIFSDINLAINWLETQPRFRDKTNLDYIKNAFNLLNINFDNTSKVHVAGTNGKGSTSAFITNILVNNNYNVGTFTSPYLIKFNERIKINNILISDEQLIEYINFFYTFNEELFTKYNYRLSFFELVTLISFKYFSDAKVDVIVIEVGIGGRLDATNILNYDISIITSIGLDHIKQLGNTLESITFEKMSILKENGYLISNLNNPLQQQIIKYANNINAKYKFINNEDIKMINKNSFNYLNDNYDISLLGSYQKENAVLAIEAVKYLFNLNYLNIKDSIKNTTWAGRLELVSPNVYLDGAHNIPAIKVLMSNINELFKNNKVTILFSALKDKEIEAMLNIIKQYPFKIVLTSFPDFRFESLTDFQTNDINYLEDGFKTFKQLKNKKEDNEIIIATGSLHFIGYLKQNLILEGADNEKEI